MVLGKAPRFAVSALLLITLWAAPAAADKSEALYKQGVALEAQGKVDEAIAAFEGAVADRPGHVMAWASLGKLYKQKQQYDKAVNAYEKATTLSPKSAALWANLGYAYYRAGREDDALRALIKSCNIDPKVASVHAFLGTIKSKKGDLKGAIANLKQATKLEPGDAEYWNNLGVAYRRAKQYPPAVEAFKKALALGETAQIHFDLAVVYRVQEEVDLAIEHYSAATRLDPKMAPAWYDLGIMHRLNHDNPKAVEAFEMWLQITGGKTKEADQVKKEIEALGGTPVDKRKDKKK